MDALLLVKRAPWMWFRELKTMRRRPRLVWDMLDFWTQPSGNAKSQADLTDMVDEIKRELQPDLLIAATKAMAEDLGGVYLPHHSRPELAPRPPRARLQLVGYDGNSRYLGTWREALTRACDTLGLTFVENPADLHQVDLFVAFRDGIFDGWACRRWKSGVKYVNAIASGRPIVSQPSAAFDEIAPVGEVVTKHSQLVDVLAGWRSLETRELAYQDGLRRAGAYTLEAVAKRYRAILAAHLREAA